MASFLPHADRPHELARARVLHYHDSMEPHFWATCLERLAPAHPEVHEWLSARGSLGNAAPKPWRLVTQGLRLARGLPRRRYRLRAQPA
jgi:hypothetical protein